MKTKAKGHAGTVAKPELLAFARIADVVEVVKPIPFARGFLRGMRGFESHRRLQLKAPVEVAPPSRAVNCTAEAIQVRTSIIRLQAVELKRRFHDLPQLPDRMPQIR
jgi:hypothetical protein